MFCWQNVDNKKEEIDWEKKSWLFESPVCPQSQWQEKEAVSRVRLEAGKRGHALKFFIIFVKNRFWDAVNRRTNEKYSKNQSLHLLLKMVTRLQKDVSFLSSFQKVFYS